jgi:hypothetical protein
MLAAWTGCGAAFIVGLASLLRAADEIVKAL